MKRCKTCNAYKMLYRKWFVRYWRGHTFYCVLRGARTAPDFCCKNWRKKSADVHYVTVKDIDDAFCDVKALSELLKEDGANN